MASSGTAPLLGVRVPASLGWQREGYRAPGPGGVQLAVVLQAFQEPKAQACLAGICELYVSAGVRLLAVEGADGPIRPTPGAVDIRQLIATQSVSAGVLSLLNGGKAKVDVWGVDRMDLIPPSHRAMGVVSSARASRERVFEIARRHLLAAQGRRYPAELGEARRARLGLYESRETFIEQARFCQSAARRVGLDLRGFPLVTRFLEIGEREPTLSPKRVRAQQEEFVRRVLTRVHGWHKPAGRNRITIDLQKATPVLVYWLEETGQSAEEFYAGLDRSTIEPKLLACKEWYDSWLTAKATAGASHEFYELLMRMALRLEVPYFDLRAFRQSVAQARDMGALRVGLDDELTDLVDALVDRAGGRALGDLEDRFDLVHRMLHLAASSQDAEAEVEEIESLSSLVDELLALAGDDAPSDPRLACPADLARADEALAAAKEFLRLSRQRSEHMVARTLELIAQRREDRAVLAVGGFHSRAISRAMDDYPQVSWAIIQPEVDVEAGWRQHHQQF